MPNPLHSKFDGFKTEYIALLSSILVEVAKKKGFSNVSALISAVFKNRKFLHKLKGLFVKYIGKFYTGKSASWILRRKVGNITLSKAIWKNVFQTQKIIKNELKSILGTQVNWQKAAQSIFKLKLSNAELPAYMKKLIRFSKKFGIGSIEYERELKKVIKQISKLNNLGLGAQGRLRKAYLNLANLTSATSEVQLRKAIRRALLAKSKYIAERLARTEMARAYGETAFENFKKEDIPAYKWTLSSRHPRLDICDFHAKTNHYGLGYGIYPSNRAPAYPAHPNCMCSLTAIYTTKNKPRFDKNAGKEWLMQGDNKKLLRKRDQGVNLNRTKNPEKLIPSYSKIKKI